MQLLSILSGVIVGMLAFVVAYRTGHSNGFYLGLNKGAESAVSVIREKYNLTEK